MTIIKGTQTPITYKQIILKGRTVGAISSQHNHTKRIDLVRETLQCTLQRLRHMHREQNFHHDLDSGRHRCNNQWHRHCNKARQVPGSSTIQVQNWAQANRPLPLSSCLFRAHFLFRFANNQPGKIDAFVCADFQTRYIEFRTRQNTISLQDFFPSCHRWLPLGPSSELNKAVTRTNLLD